MAYSVKNSLFVRNLSPNVTESILREVFSQCDEIESIVFRAFPNQNNQFFAQIDFKSSKGVTGGSALNGTKIMGTDCLVGVVDPLAGKIHQDQQNQKMKELKQSMIEGVGGGATASSIYGEGQDKAQGVQAEYFKQQKEAMEDQSYRTVHMTGFKNGVTPEALKLFCEHFGEVEGCRVEEPEGLAPFALVEFKERGPAHVVKTQKTYEVDGRVVTFTESQTMVNAISFAEKSVHFQQPIFDFMSMKAVLAQQGHLNQKLAQVREAALGLNLGKEPTDDDSAAKASAEDKPEDKSADKEAESKRKRRSRSRGEFQKAIDLYNKKHFGKELPKEREAEIRKDKKEKQKYHRDKRKRSTSRPKGRHVPVEELEEEARQMLLEKSKGEIEKQVADRSKSREPVGEPASEQESPKKKKKKKKEKKAKKQASSDEASEQESPKKVSKKEKKKKDKKQKKQKAVAEDETSEVESPKKQKKKEKKKAAKMALETEEQDDEASEAEAAEKEKDEDNSDGESSSAPISLDGEDAVDVVPNTEKIVLGLRSSSSSSSSSRSSANPDELELLPDPDAVECIGRSRKICTDTVEVVGKFPMGSPRLPMGSPAMTTPGDISSTDSDSSSDGLEEIGGEISDGEGTGPKGRRRGACALPARMQLARAPAKMRKIVATGPIGLDEVGDGGAVASDDDVVASDDEVVL